MHSWTCDCSTCFTCKHCFHYNQRLHTNSVKQNTCLLVSLLFRLKHGITSIKEVNSGMICRIMAFHSHSLWAYSQARSWLPLNLEVHTYGWKCNYCHWVSLGIYIYTWCRMFMLVGSSKLINEPHKATTWCLIIFCERVEQTDDLSPV